MLKKLLAIILLIWSIIVLGYLSINQDAIRMAGEQKAIERVERARVTTRFLSGVYDALGAFTDLFFTVILPISIVGVLSILIFAAWTKINESRWSNRHHARNGIFPLIDQALRLPDGSRATLTTNPNLLVAPQTLTVHNGAMAYGYQLPNVLSEDGQLHALRIGRQANNLQAMPAQRAGGIQRMLESAKPPALAGSETPPRLALPDATIAPMTISEAFSQSTETEWIIGRAGSGQLAKFDTQRDVHAAILGATGTGKSAGAGMTFVGHALKNGHRIIVLDGKGGDDWSPFTGMVEHHESDAGLFPAQIERLLEEFHTRKSGGDCHPLLVVVEEYGDINYTLGSRLRAGVNDQLATLMRLGRSLDMRFVFIDQYPEKWEKQILNNTKWKAVHWLQNAAIVNEYRAHELSANGEFLLRGNRFCAFHVKPHATRLLEMAMPQNYPLLIDGECERVEDAPGENVSRSTFVQPSVGKWHALIAQYVKEHPEAMQEPPPRGTIAELARRMAEADGEGKPYENYKGEASEGLRGLRVG